MTPAIAYVLAVVAGALALFMTDRVRVDVVAVLAVLALVAGRILTPEEAFRSFGNEALVFLAGLFVLAGALLRTGVMDSLGRALAARARGSVPALERTLVATAAAISTFLSNAVTAALLVPVAGGLSRRAGLRPRRVLMPIAFATMLGGVCTLVGTSTNVVVSGQLARAGLAPYSLFELTPIGVPILLVGLAYLFTVAPVLLGRLDSGAPPREAAQRTYVGELIVAPTSSWSGKTLRQLEPRGAGVEVLGLLRGANSIRTALPDEQLQPGDRVVVRATAQDLLAMADAARLQTAADRVEEAPERRDLALVEIMIAPGSTLVGQTLAEARFRHRFGAVALAIYRRGVEIAAKVGRLRLHSGDVLLVQGSREAMDELADDEDLIVLDDVTHHRPHAAKRFLALGLFAASLIAGVLTGQLAVSVLAGAAAAVLTGCLSAEEAHESIDFRMIVLVGGMFAVSSAMGTSGAADWLALRLVDSCTALGPRSLLAAFFVLTALLTQPLSNNAAAMVVIPVALAAAERTGIPARQLAVTVTVAASCSFMTPLEPASVLAWAPGRYRFRDFTLVGAPLTLLVGALTVALVPLEWR